MGERVDAERRLLNEEDAQNARVHKAALVVTPTKATDQSWQDESEESYTPKVVLVLEFDHWIFVQVLRAR